MSRHGTADVWESPEEERVDYTIPIHKKELGNPPPGSTVVMRGNFRADSATASGVDVKRAWNKEYPMILNGDVYQVIIPGLAVGETYEYKVFVTCPDKTYREFPEGGYGRNKRITVKEPSPSPTAGAEDVRKRIKGRVEGILEAAQDRSTATTLDALFDDLENDINELSIREDITPLAVEIVSEAVREMDTLPAAVREKFPKDNPPEDLPEMERRLRAGAAKYKRTVFEALRKNPEARKIFHLEGGEARYNPRNPLGRPVWNRVFFRLCNGRDLGHLASDLGKALDGVVNVPARSPKLALERRQLLERAAARLTPEKRNAIVEVAKGIPSDRPAEILDTLIQGGWLLGSATWPAALGGLALKGLAETVFGVGVSDIAAAGIAQFKGEEGGWGRLGKQFLTRNLLTRMLTSKREVAEGKKEPKLTLVKRGVKNVLKEALLRSIPGSPLFYEPSEAEHGHEEGEEGAHGAHEEHHEEHGGPVAAAKVEKLIAEACEKSLK